MKNFILLTLFLFSQLAFGQSLKLGQYDEITTNDTTLDEVVFSKDIDVDTTRGIYLPSGTTAQRPSPIKDGMLRYNNETDQAEIYAAGSWQPVGGGISDWITAKSYLVGDLVIEGRKIYQCLNNHTSGTFATDLANGEWEEISGTAFDSTGLISGGILSIDTDTSKFDISSHELAFYGEFLAVSCPALNAQSVTNIATADITFILIDNTCAITQQTTFPTPQEQRLKAFIGRVNHPNRTTIQSTFNSPNLVTKTNAQLYDLMDSLGPFNQSGNQITPNGANLSLNRAAGVIYRRGINYAADPENPHEKTFSSATVANLFRSTQNAIGTTLFTTLDVANYDNGSGVVAVGGGSSESTNQRVYLLASGNLAVQYGQHTYGSLAAAVAAIPNESFVPNENILSSGVLIGVVSCTKNATAANNDNQCVFSKVSKFDSSGVSVGSNSVATLQSAYNNSVTPQIITSTSLGSFDLRRGSGADSDNIFRGQNGSGSTTFAITGNGAVTASSTITGSNLSGTNTGDLTTGGDNDTPATTATIVVPNKQLTLTGTNQYRLNTGNANELENANFEHTTVGTGWTVSNATASGNTTAQFEGKKSLSLALTGALSLSQSSTINAARKSGVQMVASIWVNSSDVSDLQLCSLKNGSEDKCTVSGGYVQGSGWRQLTVSFLGDSTSNGLKLKSTDTTGTVLVDSAFVGVGSPVVDFTPDNVYSAKFTNTGVTSDENTDWVNGNASVSSNDFTITFTSGVFTVTPNCFVTSTDTSGDDSFGVVSAASPTAVTVSIYDIAGGISTRPFNVICQKQGADYKTSKAYVASSSDVGWTSYVPTIVGFGTTSAQAFEWKRDGDSLYIRGTFTAGTPAATEARLPLPNSVVIDSGIATLLSGAYYKGDAAVVHGGPLIVQGGLSYLKFSNPAVYGSVSASALTAVNGSDIANSSEIIKVEAGPIRITDWQDSTVIVGSFQGYNETPGASKVEMFSFSYGTTNATTVCSASPCSYLDQIGSAVTSVTRTISGQYAANFSKTYSKVKCAASVLNPTGTGAIPYGSVSFNVSCSNCNSLVFASIIPSTGGYTDSFGTFVCQATP